MLDFSDLMQAKWDEKGNGQLDPIDKRPLYNCWNFVREAFSRFGVNNVPAFDINALSTEDVAREYEVQEGSGAWERLDRPEAPCVVAMRTHRRAVQAVNHFGIYIGRNRFLHIRRTHAPRREFLNEPPWPKQVEGFWRWRG